MLTLTLAEGQMVNQREDLNRLFHHFRAQGYEGIIAKDWNGPYHLATRDPAWVKRKPEITLDLVLHGRRFRGDVKGECGHVRFLRDQGLVAKGAVLRMSATWPASIGRAICRFKAR